MTKLTEIFREFKGINSKIKNGLFKDMCKSLHDRGCYCLQKCFSKRSISLTPIHTNNFYDGALNVMT